MNMAGEHRAIDLPLSLSLSQKESLSPSLTPTCQQQLSLLHRQTYSKTYLYLQLYCRVLIDLSVRWALKNVIAVLFDEHSNLARWSYFTAV